MLWQALLHILHRYAFAPAKNDRLDQTSDASSCGLVAHALVCAARGVAVWGLQLFLSEPFEFAFPYLVRGADPVSLDVHDDGSIEFPVGVAADERLAVQSDLGDTLLQCFLGYNFQGGRLPMLTFLQRLYAKQKAANIALQRQVCWCLGMVVEAQLLSENQNSPRTAGLRSTSVQELSDEMWSFNYWGRAESRQVILAHALVVQLRRHQGWRPSCPCLHAGISEQCCNVGTGAGLPVI